MRTRFWLSRGPHSQCRILFLNTEDPRHLLLRLSRARETTHGHHANCELGEGRHGLSTVSHHEERESALPGMVGLKEARIRTLIGTRQICHWASVLRLPRDGARKRNNCGLFSLFFPCPKRDPSRVNFSPNFNTLLDLV